MFSESNSAKTPLPDIAQPGQAFATFAGGCFWCMQPPFDEIEGVLKTQVGYTGGPRPAPTYEQICTGATGHAEAIRITYDTSRVSYLDLLKTFWRNIDPTTKNRQFYDSGTQYRTSVFYHNEEQHQEAESSKSELEALGRFTSPIVTEIVPAAPFWEAEDYHQQYYVKCPLRYQSYSSGSGRKDYLKRTWET